MLRIEFEPVGRRGDFPAGTLVLDAARALGVGLASVCGGEGSCGRCKVQITGRLTPVTDDETASLDAEEPANGYRLGCQAQALSDLVVSIPAESLTGMQRVHLEGLGAAEVAVDPVVVPHDAVLAPASLHDSRSDWTRLSNAISPNGNGPISCDTAVLKGLPEIARDGSWKLRACQRDHEIVGLLQSGRQMLEVAVDLGTTTLAGYLLSLETSQVVARRGVMNPQIAYGEDVMSRIGHAMEGPENASTLQRAVVDAISEMVVELTTEAGASPDQVVEYVVVGNTAMHHLFLGLPVRQLGHAPYIAAISEAMDVKARDLGLPSSAGAYVHLLPNIAGFVGADHVAMLLATQLAEMKGTAVALDIGTNTEISLAHNGEIFCCSCASGPAFEGAHLHDGMRAAPGAIERVRIAGGKLAVQTVDHAPAVGICGSGVLDAIAQLRLDGQLDVRGRFKDRSLPRSEKDGEMFVLVPASRSGIGRDIVLTRQDVNQVQLAKAA
jgi:uncharacterized 2Fe-2S/4Fe-4S cluster protein (DUF4445 family)